MNAATMTDAEILQWIDVINHEVARETLRDYMRLRSTLTGTATPNPEGEPSGYLPAVKVQPADTLPSGPEHLVSKAWVHEGCAIALYGTNDKLIGWIDTHEWVKGRVYRDSMLASTARAGVSE